MGLIGPGKIHTTPTPDYNPSAMATQSAIPPAATPAAPPATPAPLTPAAAAALAKAKIDEYNRTRINFRSPVPRPKVHGLVIDFHTHLVAHRHAAAWFESARHFGIDCFATMTPLEEALRLQRDYPGRLHFITIPKWGDSSAHWLDDWLRRIEAFYNIGSRMVKFHMAPGTMAARNWRLDQPAFVRLRKEIADRNMIFMSHVGDPDTWYSTKYADATKYGTRDEHYALWEGAMSEHKDRPWLGAHLGGNPEDIGRLDRLLAHYPNLSLDCSATRWIVREVSKQRDAMRDFFIRHQDRIIFGSDQVSGDDRGFDFLSSRFWAHRKLWETAYIGPSPILDPDLPKDHQPPIRGLALPDEVLQKLYHDNAVALLARVGARFGVV